jgi:uncharacterized protein
MKIFVDTSAWLALADRSDQHHAAAVAKSSEIKRRKIALITSEYVFDEAVTLILYRISHRAAVMFGDSLVSSNIAVIEDVNELLRNQAWELFKRYSDKELSFTDCTSFVLMRRQAITKAFTFDAHFKQMGFRTF